MIESEKSWQSGLDYSEFAGEFANVFIRSDYMTALECYAVIEESVKDIPELKKSEIVRLLGKKRKNSSNEKNSLTEALITTLN
jgi:hypothetical protein